MNIVVFEDAQVDQLYPITTGRAAYAISCASYRLIDWLARFDSPLVGIVRPHLRTLQLLDFPYFTPQLSATQSRSLIVNARLVPSLANFRLLQQLIAENREGVVRAGVALAAAVIPTKRLATKDDASMLRSIESACNDLEPPLPQLALPLQLFDFPHDVIRWNQACFAENLQFRLHEGAYQEIKPNLFVSPGAVVGEYVIADSAAGPIVVDEGAQIGPYCFLRGPAYLGPGARLLEHSAIKDFVSLGHTTKIGGEIEASVIEPFTNKQHHGFLGHSYLGSWINLGAGTCNSDLKNTYGEVKLDIRGQKIATGMQFVGSIIGDYAKTAINTGIFTGKILGTCSMIYGFVTTNVPSFVNYARSFGQVTELPPSVMESTQKRMFARRQVTQRPCDIQLLHDMYQLTRHERQLTEEPLVF